ncbi:MAG: Mov34/MPN/PAD-1 family protein [Solirubrobacteraceae bacterium]
MKISSDLLDELVGHAQEDPKNETCGVVAVLERTGAHQAGRVGPSARAVEVHRAVNVHGSPLKFEIDPAELLALYNTIDERDLELGAIYHSHVRSAPYPSQTDIGFAANWPGVEWIIVGLKDGEAPEVRSYLIEDGRVREVALEVE